MYFYNIPLPINLWQSPFSRNPFVPFLHTQAYHIVQETMLEEEGKYYTVLKAMPGKKDGCFSDHIHILFHRIVNYFLRRIQCNHDFLYFYTVLKAMPGKKDGCFSDAEWLYGKYNLETRCAVLQSYLQKENRVLDNILSASVNTFSPVNCSSFTCFMAEKIIG